MDISLDQYQYKITQLDNNRKISHNAAIDACAQINRLCDSYHLPHICPETDASRDKVANFCAVITNEFFMEGVNYDIDSMDQVIVSLEKANNKIQNRDIMHNIESEIQI